MSYVTREKVYFEESAHMMGAGKSHVSGQVCRLETRRRVSAEVQV